MQLKKSKTIWGNSKLKYFRKTFITQRKRIASKLQNPKINRITFHTLRHFYGTTEYYRTKDILYVKEDLVTQESKAPSFTYTL